MKRLKIVLLCVLLCVQAVLSTGCWNYREVDEFGIVAGAAVDKGKSGRYILTVELVKIIGGKDSQATGKLLSAEGDSLFDAARNLISISGIKLYWSHAKVIILSQQIAVEGVDRIMDWYCRDAETREDTCILISKETTAKEVLEVKPIAEDIQSFEIIKTINNEKGLGKALETNILQYNINMDAPGSAAVIPTIYLRKQEEPVISIVDGCAVVKEDRLLGFLDGEDTKYLNFILNEVEGGLLIHSMQEKVEPSVLSLEIFRSKTKTTVEMDPPKAKIETKITAALGEISGDQNYDNREGMQAVEKAVQEATEEKIQQLIHKVQEQFGADIFQFAQLLYQNNPKAYKEVEGRWDEVFRSLSVEAKVDISLENSGIIYNN